MDKKLNPQQEKFLDYVFSQFPNITEQVYKEARAYAGYSDGYSVHQIVDKLKDEIIERTKQAIAVYGMEAFGEQIKLMRNPGDKWWRAKLSISEAILDRIGVVEKANQDMVVQPVGFIVIPEKKTEPCEESQT